MTRPIPNTLRELVEQAGERVYRPPVERPTPTVRCVSCSDRSCPTCRAIDRAAQQIAKTLTRMIDIEIRNGQMFYLGDAE